MEKCPCHSGRAYTDCCEPFHHGIAIPTPEQLMRSRYAAYAKGLSDYILATTHPSRRGAISRESIDQFSRNTDFRDLKILAVEEGADQSYVTFQATLFQQEHDGSFIEKSLFEKIEGRWLYVKAVECKNCF